MGRGKTQIYADLYSAQQKIRVFPRKSASKKLFVVLSDKLLGRYN